ncbi:hypothetical protein BKI52_13460 [marine bacterium AO1-C]|nr:hypothetical protein BKI52_13460 [marine bacterium AO1-C]
MSINKKVSVIGYYIGNVMLNSNFKSLQRTKVRSEWKVFLISFFIIISLSSCSVTLLRKSNNSGIVYLTEKNLHLLDGEYLNASSLLNDVHLEVQASSHMNTSSLWRHLAYFHGDNVYAEHLEHREKEFADYVVKIKVKNPRRIKAELWFRQTLVTKKTLKGKLDNGFFVLNKASRMIGIPGLIFTITNIKSQLTLNNEGQLSIDGAYTHGGAVLFLGADHGESYSLLFKRKK